MPYCPQCQGHFKEGQFCPSDGTHLVPDAETASETDPLVGQIIADRFRVLDRLGAGGMGTVYRAEHIYIKKIVALKLLRPEITANPEAITRFQREALAASTIGHESIVRIDDFGRLPDGQVYLTMEFLEGRPLNDVLRHGPPPLEFVLEIALQTCHGLAAAHSKGIVHRDMKPENIFVAEGNKAKILDFGIAKVIRSDENTNLTKTGAVFGTPNYMAPEQALGRKVDHRADVYSMGVILYEMATGELPFQSDSCIAILAQHVTEPPQPPRQTAPHRQISERLERTILEAMAKDPETRLQDMSGMIAALLEVRKEVLGDRPLPSGLGLSRVPLPAVPVEVPDGVDTVREGAAAKVTATAGELLPPAGSLATAPGGRGKRLLLGLTTLAVLAGAAVTGVKLLKRPAATAASASQPAAIADAAPPQQAKPAKENLPEPAQLVDVILDSEPRGAAIEREGKKLGETPDVIKVPAGTKVEVQLSLPGYQPRQVTVVADHAEKKLVKLDRSGSKAKARRVITERLAGKVDREALKRKARRRRKPASDHGDHGSDHGGGEPLDPY